jgi:hypothetical protein
MKLTGSWVRRRLIVSFGRKGGGLGGGMGGVISACMYNEDEWKGKCILCVRYVYEYEYC